jgi:hypothetical protein
MVPIVDLIKTQILDITLFPLTHKMLFSYPCNKHSKDEEILQHTHIISQTLVSCVLLNVTAH